MKKIFLSAAVALISSFAFAQQFAHVDYASLVQLCPEADGVRAQMEEVIKVNNDVLTEMRSEYETKLAQYNKNKSVWSQTILASKETELGQLEERISTTYQQMQGELQQKQVQLMEPVQKKVRDAVTSLAKAGGFVYVFDSSSFVYIDETKAADLTPKARLALNIPEGRTLETLQQEIQSKLQQQAQ